MVHVSEMLNDPIDPEAFIREVQNIPGTLLTYKVAQQAGKYNREIIHCEGDPANLFVVIEGLVSIEILSHTNDRIIYDFRGKGDLFGDLYDLPYYINSAYPSTAIGATVRRLDRTLFEQHGFCGYIQRTLVRECLHGQAIRIDMAQNTSMRQRVSKILFYLADKHYDQFHDPNNKERVKLPLRQHEISDFVDGHRSSVAHAFSEIKRDCVIQREGMYITFSLEALDAYIQRIEEQAHL